MKSPTPRRPVCGLDGLWVAVSSRPWRMRVHAAIERSGSSALQSSQSRWPTAMTGNANRSAAIVAQRVMTRCTIFPSYYKRHQATAGGQGSSDDLILCRNAP
jgi:hypothetical protein